MKTLRLLFGMALVLFMVLAPQSADAQRGHHERDRAYTPYWIPAHIIAANVRHVYFPEYNVYFDRRNGTYVYLEGRRWVVSRQLPYCLHSTNFVRAYKVGLHLNTARPYIYNQSHQANYHYRIQNHYDNSYYKKGRKSKYSADTRGRRTLHYRKKKVAADRRRN